MEDTFAKAKADAIAAGFVGEPTPEVLMQFGWKPGNDIQHALFVEMAAPARTPEQVQQDAQLLIEEAKANNVPAKVMNMMTKVLGAAIKLV